MNIISEKMLLNLKKQFNLMMLQILTDVNLKMILSGKSCKQIKIIENVKINFYFLSS